MEKNFIFTSREIKKKAIGKKMEKTSFLICGKWNKRPFVKKWKKLHFYFGGNFKKGHSSTNGKK